MSDNKYSINTKRPTKVVSDYKDGVPLERHWQPAIRSARSA